jgi:hypothetical protein
MLYLTFSDMGTTVRRKVKQFQKRLLPERSSAANRLKYNMPEVIANLNKMKCRVEVRKLASRDVPAGSDSDDIIIETATSDSEDDIEVIFNSANKTVSVPSSSKVMNQSGSLKNQSHWHTECSLTMISKTMLRPQLPSLMLPSLMLPMEKVAVWLTTTANLGGEMSPHEQSCQKDDPKATDLNESRVFSGLTCQNFYGVK